MGWGQAGGHLGEDVQGKDVRRGIETRIFEG